MAEADTTTHVWGRTCLGCRRPFTQIPSHPEHPDLCIDCGQHHQSQRRTAS